MTTTALPLWRNTRTPRRRYRSSADSHAADIELAVIVRADRKRVSQALILPEYVEAWLAFPEPQVHGTVSMYRSGTAYCISRTGGGADIRICGSYRAMRRGKVVLSWQNEHTGTPATSIVSFSLYGEFDRTKLVLFHSGFASERDYLWHLELWAKSLARLKALFSF